MRPQRMSLANILMFMAMLVLTLSGFGRRQPPVLTVERINIVDSTGALALVLSNGARLPGAMFQGRGVGDEVGGLIYEGAARDSGYRAFGHLSFDQWKQNQVVALQYQDHGRSRSAGLRVWDRPDNDLERQFALAQRMLETPPGPLRDSLDAERRRVRTEVEGKQRLFLVCDDRVSATNTTIQLSLANLDFVNQLVEPAVPVNQLSIAWSSEASTIASVQPASGLVTSILNGSTVVHASITGGIPSNVLLGGLAARLGASVPVTVAATTPPSGSGFRVTGITGADTPIQFVDTYGLTAQVVNAPAGQLRIKWRVTYSNGVLPNIETAYGPNAYTLSVAEGSYNIQVTAMPLVAAGGGAPAVYGTPAIVDFPVCTGSGDTPPPRLQAALPDDGDVPSAVGGC